MSLKELVESAPIMSDVKDFGVLVLRDGPGGFILDRISTRIVKKPYVVSGLGESNDIDNWFRKSYRHSKDLLCIASKYDFKTALEYELNVVKQDLKNAASDIYFALKDIYR
jgi:hypothetical protein